MASLIVKEGEAGGVCFPAEVVDAPWVIEKLVTIAWFFVFALPWIYRRLRGKSSGDGRVAKYPTPTKWPIR